MYFNTQYDNLDPTSLSTRFDSQATSNRNRTASRSEVQQKKSKNSKQSTSRQTANKKSKPEPLANDKNKAKTQRSQDSKIEELLATTKKLGKHKNFLL